MRRLRARRVRLSEARGGSLNRCDWSQTGGLIISSTDRIQPTFPRSAAWERRNPVRVLPMYGAYMGIMASMCASPAELAESSSPYRWTKKALCSLFEATCQSDSHLFPKAVNCREACSP